MTTEAETTKSPKGAPVRQPDDAIRILSLQFKGSTDLPPITGKFGGEQAITRIGTGDRGEHRFDITFRPQFGLYVVKVFKLVDSKPGPQVAEYLIPREWAIASLAVKADSAPEAGSAKLGA